jgi:hypothetical protein
MNKDMINKSDLMIGDFFNISFKDSDILKIKILKIGDKQVDILVNDLERVCLINSLLPIKLTKDVLNSYKFEYRNLKIGKEQINDLSKVIDDLYIISLTSNGEDKYNLSIKNLNGEKICESYNIEYLHTLQNIVRSHIKYEII